MPVIKWHDKLKKGGEKCFAKGIGLEEEKVEGGGVSYIAYARVVNKYVNTRCQSCNHIRADHIFKEDTNTSPCSPMNTDRTGNTYCRCRNFVEYGEVEAR